MEAHMRLRAWRISKGWTQEEAAKHLGVRQSLWSSWEVGRTKPGLNYAMALAQLSAKDGEPSLPLKMWVHR